MPTKNVIANFTFAISVILLCLAWYLYSHSKCNSYNGHFTESQIKDLKPDQSEEITKKTAGEYFSLVNTDCNTPYGAWIGRQLLDSIISKKDSKGVFLFTGINILLGQQYDHSTCFILKAGYAKLSTQYLFSDTSKYYKLDALCPSLCDGMDPLPITHK